MPNYFDKEDTKVIKGIAILLMIAHHIWGFPSRLYSGGGFPQTPMIFGEPYYLYIGRFGKICVSIYFFLSGYGICKSSQKGNINILAKLKKLYFSYWKVFLIFIPIAFLFFSKQEAYCNEVYIYTRYETFRGAEFLLNFLGLSSSYNLEWWFFLSYVIAIFTFPFVNKLMDNRPVSYNIAGIIVFSILVNNVFPAIGQLDTLGNLNANWLYVSLFCQSSPYITCFWMGILMAKEDLLSKTQNCLLDNRCLNPFVDFLALLVIPFLYNHVWGPVLDLIQVPALIIFSLDLLNHSRFIRNQFEKLGTQSTNMWFIHSFFCYYFGYFARIVVITKSPLLSLITLLMMTYFAAVLTDALWKNVFAVSKKIKVPSKKKN